MDSASCPALVAPAAVTLAFVRALPKVDLHAHLNGSIPCQILQELIREDTDAAFSATDWGAGGGGGSSAAIVSAAPAGDGGGEHGGDAALTQRQRDMLAVVTLRAGDTRSLAECFAIFDVIHSVVRSVETVTRIARECVLSFARDGCVYLELRTTPRRDVMTAEEYVAAVEKGLAEGEAAAAAEAEVQAERERLMEDDEDEDEECRAAAEDEEDEEGTRMEGEARDGVEHRDDEAAADGACESLEAGGAPCVPAGTVGTVPRRRCRVRKSRGGRMSSTATCTSRITARLLLSINRSQSADAARRTVDLALALVGRPTNKYVVGVELSGNPHSGSFEAVLPELERARRGGLPVSVHAAEVVSHQETSSMLRFRPERLGHALHLTPQHVELIAAAVPPHARAATRAADAGAAGSVSVAADAVANAENGGPQRDEVTTDGDSALPLRPIPIEVCPTSNRLTLHLESLEDHPRLSTWLDR